MSGVKKTADIVPILFMGTLFVFVDLLAFLVAGPFEAAGAGAFENPSDPFNLLYFLVIVLLFTGVILLIVKLGKKQALRMIFLGAVSMLIFYVLSLVLDIFVTNAFLNLGLSIAFTAILLISLVKKPEWYVLDAIAIFTAVGAVAIIGISLDIWIVIVLLIIMAVYDAISVYKTKHMVDLADSVMDLKLPIMFVIPKKKGYSFLEETKGLKQKLEEEEERQAYFLGVGDVVFPGFLAVAAFHNLANNGFIMAMSVLAGTLFGFVALMFYVVRGKPQAGLPLLCSGAILGYAVVGFIIFGFPPL
jgi:presenilin-like A22 family membrane protease